MKSNKKLMPPPENPYSWRYETIYNESFFNFSGLEHSLLFRFELFNFHYENILLDYKFPDQPEETDIEFTTFEDKLETILEESDDEIVLI